MFRFATIFACAALACSVAPASAQSRVEAGALECRGGASTSFIVGSVTELSCVFRPSAGGAGERYRAVIRHVGLDLGFTEQSAVIWAVLAPSKVIGAGDLAGNYGGVQAGASVGVGVGANVLVGGSNNSFALQPVSVQAQTGLSVAAGIASLELRYVR
jgi:hypothetical protein